jgi:CrcB protein
MLMQLWVALGSALGGVARYGCALLAADLAGDAFPWGTIFINVLGSFVIGFFATVTGTDGRFLVRSEVRVFVMVGICGGYTTFSSFSLQTFLLAREGSWLAAVANVAVSMILCLVAVWIGHTSAASFSRPPRGAKKIRR